MLRLASIVIAAIFTANLLLLSQTCAAQSDVSKAHNDLGCTAMADHDYERAEKLFTDAFSEAEKAHDQKRMKTAADNLAALYSAQGRTAEAEALAARMQKLLNPPPKQVYRSLQSSPAPDRERPSVPGSLITYRASGTSQVKIHRDLYPGKVVILTPLGGPKVRLYKSALFFEDFKTAVALRDQDATLKIREKGMREVDSGTSATLLPGGQGSASSEEDNLVGNYELLHVGINSGPLRGQIWFVESEDISLPAAKK